MAHVDYDKKKFVRDSYGRLYPKKIKHKTKAQRLQSAMESPCLSHYVK